MVSDKDAFIYILCMLDATAPDVASHWCSCVRCLSQPTSGSYSSHRDIEVTRVGSTHACERDICMGVPWFDLGLTRVNGSFGL